MGSCQSSGTVAVDATKVKRVKNNSVVSKRNRECIDTSIDDSMTGSMNATTRDRMKLWKEELEASGNLTKTVVRIEVSVCVVRSCLSVGGSAFRHPSIHFFL